MADTGLVDDMPKSAGPSAEGGSSIDRSGRLTNRMDFSVDAVVVALSVWTVVFQVAVATGMGRNTALAVWLLGCSALFAAQRLCISRSGGLRLDLPFESVDVRIALAVCGVLLAAVVSFVDIEGIAWLAVWTALLVGLGLGLSRSRVEERFDARPQSADVPLRHLASVLLLVLVVVLLCLTLVRPDRDDVFLMNRATWIEEHSGEFPTRDTIFSDNVLPSQRPPGPQTAIEPLIGTLGAWLPWSAASIAYLGVAPVVSALSVLALWRLLRTLRVRTPVLACWVGSAWLFLDGAANRTFGNMWLGRSWQGKVIFILIVVPFLWHHAIAYGRGEGHRHLVLLVSGVVAGFGLSLSAVLVSPFVIVAGVSAGAVAHGRYRRLAMASIPLLPVLVAAIWISRSELQLAAPMWPSMATIDLSAVFRYEIEPISLVRMVFGRGSWSLVALASIFAAWAVVRDASSRLVLLFGPVVVFVVLFAPRALDTVAGVDNVRPIFWRVFWVLPVPALVGAFLTSVAVLGSRAMSLRKSVCFCALILVASTGSPITCVANRGATLTWPPKLKLPLAEQESAVVLAGLASSGDLVAGPSSIDFAISVQTSLVKTVNPRPNYLQGRHVVSGFHAGERRLLSSALDGGIGTEQRDDLRSALDLLEPTALCLRRSADGVAPILEQSGFRPVGYDDVCEFWVR
jgi:hypothetical protein